MDDHRERLGGVGIEHDLWPLSAMFRADSLGSQLIRNQIRYRNAMPTGATQQVVGTHHELMRANNASRNSPTVVWRSAVR